jgi:hypothetical protein
MKLVGTRVREAFASVKVSARAGVSLTENRSSTAVAAKACHGNSNRSFIDSDP